MADSANIIGQFKDEVGEITEEVASEVKDQAEQAAEKGAQALFGTQTPQVTPQPFDNAQGRQVQQQQLEDQKKITQTRRILKWHSDIAEAQKRVREEQKQRQMQRLQPEQVQEQKEESKILQMKQKKQAVLAPTPVSNIENKNRMAA